MKKCVVCKRSMKSTKPQLYTNGIYVAEYNVCVSCVRKGNQREKEEAIQRRIKHRLGTITQQLEGIMKRGSATVDEVRDIVDKILEYIERGDYGSRCKSTGVL